MPFTEEDYLPSYEELEVEELNLSAAPLRAAARQLGRYCDYQSKEFMLCTKEEDDPRKCIYEGKEVTRCALEFFRKLKSTCAEEFTHYWQCVDHARGTMDVTMCHKPQGVYDDCVLKHFGQENPPRGYFSHVRVHKTMREKPVRPLPLPHPTVDPPDTDNMETPETAKFGSRFWFFK